MCVCACVCLFVCKHPHVLIPTHIYTDIHAYVHTYMHTFIHRYIHTCILTYIHTYLHAYIYIYTSINSGSRRVWRRLRLSGQLPRVVEGTLSAKHQYRTMSRQPWMARRSRTWSEKQDGIIFRWMQNSVTSWSPRHYTKQTLNAHSLGWKQTSFTLPVCPGSLSCQGIVRSLWLELRVWETLKIWFYSLASLRARQQGAKRGCT